MFIVKKTGRFEACHQLSGDIFTDQCKNLHGHSWVVTVEISTERIEFDTGMAIDFGIIGHILKQFDHQFLNDLKFFQEDTPPTAENICTTIAGLLRQELEKITGTHAVLSVTVQETPNNIVTYRPISLKAYQEGRR